MKKMAADPTAAIAYATLLGAQTLLAGMLFWIMVPIFAQMIARLGETLEIDASTVVIVLGVAALLQCCYWIRFSGYRFRRDFKMSSPPTSSCLRAASVSSSAALCFRQFSSGMCPAWRFSLLLQSCSSRLSACSGACLLSFATRSNWSG